LFPTCIQRTSIRIPFTSKTSTWLKTRTMHSRMQVLYLEHGTKTIRTVSFMIFIGAPGALMSFWFFKIREIKVKRFLIINLATCFDTLVGFIMRIIFRVVNDFRQATFKVEKLLAWKSVFAAKITLF